MVFYFKLGISIRQNFFPIFTLEKKAINMPLKLNINAEGLNTVLHYIACGPTFGSGHYLYVIDLSNISTNSRLYPCSYDLLSSCHLPSRISFTMSSTKLGVSNP